MVDKLKPCPFCGGEAAFMKPTMFEEENGLPSPIQCANKCQLRGFAVTKKIWNTRYVKAVSPDDAREAFEKGIEYIYDAAPCDMPWSAEEINKLRKALEGGE